MRRTFSVACLFFAWLCAAGAVWNVVQVFAWTRMFAGYATELPVGEALRATFDPLKPCPICVAVTKAKQTEQKQAPQQIVRNVEKLLLASEAPAKILFLPSRAEWPFAPAAFGQSRTETVPVPPPRIRVA